MSSKQSTSSSSSSSSSSSTEKFDLQNVDIEKLLSTCHFCSCVVCSDDKRCGICSFIPTTIRWLPPPKIKKYIAKTVSDNGTLTMVRSFDNHSRLVHLVELSLPPLLARKFHVVNVTELMRGGEDEHYMEVATWFTVWNEANGLQLLNRIHGVYKQLEKLNKTKEVPWQNYEGMEIEKDVKLWQSSNDRFLYLMGKATKEDCYAPKLSDNAATASEFLLEPCILIQLPWSTVLLHQWLAAALVEVLVFEKSSLELRHWPLPPAVEPSAREILFLVKQLKERVILGFAIMSQQVTAYPKVDTRHPGWIMDEVVLPSLATLQFLISGKANTILKSIKKIAWSKPDLPNKNRLYIHHQAFEEEEFTYGFFAFLFYNPNHWGFLTLRSPFEPFIKEDLETVIKRLNSSKIVLQNPINKTCIRDLTKVEDMFWYGFGQDIKAENTPELHLDKKQRVELALSTIKEYVINTGRLPPLLWRVIRKFYDNDSVIMAVGDQIFEDFRHRSDIQLCVIRALLYWELYRKLNDSEGEKSALARIDILGLEIMLRDQLIVITKILGVQFDVSPVAPCLDKSPPMSVGSISKLLQEVREKRASQSRDWLWRQFASEWREPVSPQEPSFKYDIKFPALIKVCENRIGRIICNTAQKCFDVYEKGGAVFPNWQLVQYMLPCYVAMFKQYAVRSDGDFTRKITARFLDFLHGILKFYEKSFQTWHTEIRPRQIEDYKDVKLDVTADREMQELYSDIRYYKEITNLLLQTHIGTNPPVSEDIHRFQHINKVLLKWPFCIIHYNEFFYVYSHLKAWLLKSLQIYKDWHEILLQSWDFPLSSNALHYKIQKGQVDARTLVAAFKADAIMQVIEITYAKSSIHMPHVRYQKSKDIAENARVSIRAISELRFHLHYTVADHTFHIDPKDSAPEMFNNLRIALKDAYKWIKKFREYMGPVKLQTVGYLPSNPPELQIAINHYMNGNFVALEKMMEFFTAGRNKRNQNVKVSVSKAKKKSVDKKATVDDSVPSKKCRNCPKTERKWGPLVVCEQCVKDEYPDVNYFCGKACKDAWWKEEHMAEHLEFDLGLIDFSHLNLNQGV